MKICIKPRVHIGLISMHSAGCRINGGIGFTINKPQATIFCETSDSFTFTDNRDFPLGINEQKQLAYIINSIHANLNLKNSIHVEVTGDLRTHYGMGSGTSIRLACIEGLFLLNDKKTTNKDIVAYSKRGGTSGIGINTYFDGRFVFDLGVANTSNAFEPSSLANHPSPPLLLDSIDMPDWTIGLCLPTSIKPLTQEEEIHFFNNNCPINVMESYETLYHCLFGAYASIKEKNKLSFVKSIIGVQKCGFKKIERSIYGDNLSELESKLYANGAQCVGMSSLGPMLFFMADDDVLIRIKNNMPQEECNILLTNCSNTGRDVTA